ncbi:predicted protein [Naegleria gruberi]|uniref:Predicted protein n=1 Tax=Naegleria gruberi TaxID=5762 RepID=D2W471_NAEGR|nr:uncharacterized protein NAEGRDRAFT_54560 [Naegleria gruberi]EFC36129.1 predicted protein [Naegleria gruberi]|eukprot:XP_002668873.1 predicted protein [Naegleria gruberi strain NEG-M]
MLDRNSVSHHYAHLPPTPQLPATSSISNNGNGFTRKPSKYLNNIPPPNNLIVAFQPSTSNGSIQNNINPHHQQYNHSHQPSTHYNLSPPGTSVGSGIPTLLQPIQTTNGKNLLVKRSSANQLLPSLQTEKSNGNILRSISPTPQTKNFVSSNTTQVHNNITSNKSFNDTRGRAETSLGFYEEKKPKSKEKEGSEDKERLYTKYIEKLSQELDKKKRKIKELTLEIKKLNQMHISNDIDQKLIRFRSGMNMNGEGGHTYFEDTESSSSDEEEIEEMFPEQDDKEDSLKGNKLSPFSTPKSKKDSPIIDSINASRDREVKELEAQIKSWKDTADKLKDELTSTRSEFVQYKISAENEASKLLKEIQRANSSQNFEEETKVIFYKNLASHYESENKKNLVMNEKLQTELRNEKSSGNELEDLVVKQQKNFSDYQDKTSRELSECRKELDRLRRILKMSKNSDDSFIEDDEMSATFQK